MIYVFPNGKPLSAIRDRWGNLISITRLGESPGDQISRVRSPNGRWIAFDYLVDGQGNVTDRVSRAYDNLGREVNYTYATDGSATLLSVSVHPDASTTYTTQYAY